MREFATVEWDRAHRALASAGQLAETDPDSAASRAYYAAFHALTALFALRNQTFSKHSAIRAALHREGKGADLFLGKPRLASGFGDFGRVTTYYGGGVEFRFPISDFRFPIADLPTSPTGLGACLLLPTRTGQVPQLGRGRQVADFRWGSGDGGPSGTNSENSESLRNFGFVPSLSILRSGPLRVQESEFSDIPPNLGFVPAIPAHRRSQERQRRGVSRMPWDPNGFVPSITTGNRARGAGIREDRTPARPRRRRELGPTAAPGPANGFVPAFSAGGRSEGHPARAWSGISRGGRLALFSRFPTQPPVKWDSGRRDSNPQQPAWKAGTLAN